MQIDKLCKQVYIDMELSLSLAINKEVSRSFEFKGSSLAVKPN